jgi:hypothetical protein
LNKFWGLSARRPPFFREIGKMGARDSESVVATLPDEGAWGKGKGRQDAALDVKSGDGGDIRGLRMLVAFKLPSLRL